MHTRCPNTDFPINSTNDNTNLSTLYKTLWLKERQFLQKQWITAENREEVQCGIRGNCLRRHCCTFPTHSRQPVFISTSNLVQRAAIISDTGRSDCFCETPTDVKNGGLTQSDNAHDIFVSNDYCTMNRIRQLFSLPAAAAFVWGREWQRKNSNLSGGPPRSPSIRTQMAVI